MTKSIIMRIIQLTDNIIKSKIDFGMYKGLYTYEELYTWDITYLIWIFKNCTSFDYYFENIENLYKVGNPNKYVINEEPTTEETGQVCVNILFASKTGNYYNSMKFYEAYKEGSLSSKNIEEIKDFKFPNELIESCKYCEYENDYVTKTLNQEGLDGLFEFDSDNYWNID